MAVAVGIVTTEMKYTKVFRVFSSITVEGGNCSRKEQVT